MLYHGITVEHSYNCMVLLCRLFLGLSGHYTKIDNIPQKASSTVKILDTTGHRTDLKVSEYVLLSVTSKNTGHSFSIYVQNEYWYIKCLEKGGMEAAAEVELYYISIH